MFGTTEEKIIQTYRLSGDPILNAYLEPLKGRSHTIPVMPELLFLASVSLQCTVDMAAAISQI